MKLPYLPMPARNFGFAQAGFLVLFSTKRNKKNNVNLKKSPRLTFTPTKITIHFQSLTKKMVPGDRPGTSGLFTSHFLYCITKKHNSTWKQLF
jgi:hypothetical protein